MNAPRQTRESTSNVEPRGRVRRPLFFKYFIVLFGAVVVALLANGLIEALFGYRDLKSMVGQRLFVEAQSAAGRIEGFLDGISDSLQWVVQLPWREGDRERHRLDVLRLLRQSPAIVDVILVDDKGVERLHISRVEPDSIDSGIDRSNDDAVLGAFSQHTWYGPVTLHEGSEPYMTIAVTGAQASAGAAIAEINLKLIWDVVSTIRVGETGDAFVVDRPGHLVAHPDISLVLRGDDPLIAAALSKLRSAAGSPGEAFQAADLQGRSVLAAAARVAGPEWTVFAEQPMAEALLPIRTALWRTGVVLLAGGLAAAALAYVLAKRMVGPIRALETGAQRIGAGEFGHKIAISTGDELEQLADRFNLMAAELQVSQDRSERIARLKRFLAPQVAELVERTGADSMLVGHRAEIVAVFCDLRGFVAFANQNDPEETMTLLRQYYEALGRVVTAFEATLTSFSGDGAMILLNAPLACNDPVVTAIRMAIEMQKAVQALILHWRRRGRSIGFGIGLAKGAATVGRIGYEGRLDYTAIGSVVNLASRLCGDALDGQILVDSEIAAEVKDRIELVPLGGRIFKGASAAIEVFGVDWLAPDAHQTVSA